MKGKTVKSTRVIMSHVMMPFDANPACIVHGGVVMKHIDDAAAVVAVRHAGASAVTASIDRLDFHNPVFIGNLLIVKASLNLTGKTSMEIGVRVDAEDLITRKISHTASAYLTYVALDEENRPREVPQIIITSEDERRRNDEAMQRRKVRLKEKTEAKLALEC